jgi:enoyl-CoA hydratase
MWAIVNGRGATMSYQNIVVETRESVAVVTLNRPDKLNALNDRTMEELAAAFKAIGQDPATRGAILTGAGSKAFVAGADIGELSTQSPADGRERSLRGQAVFNGIEGLGKPVIAAINGYALGGGLELALACHVRVASENAKLGAPEVKLGLICGYGGTQRLPRLVGPARALEMLLTGEAVDAQEALRVGLVNRVVPAEKLLEESEALLRRMTANGPVALRLVQEAVRLGTGLPMGEALALEAALFGLACATEDMREGTRAFLDKRPPRFLGK